MNNLIEKAITFKEIERIFYEMGCEVARKLMQEFLGEADKGLEKSRDKGKLRNKGRRTTSIKTLMGEVEIKRTMYRRVNETGGVEYVYLLDEALGMDTIGSISPNLVERIVGHACEMSYREVSKAISELTGQKISHQGVWDVVQAVGKRQTEAEKKLVEAFEDNELS